MVVGYSTHPECRKVLDGVPEESSNPSSDPVTSSLHTPATVTIPTGSWSSSVLCLQGRRVKSLPIRTLQTGVEFPELSPELLWGL